MTGEEKTEEPTSRRLSKAREDGQTLNVATGNKVVSFFFVMFALALVGTSTARYVAASFDLIGKDTAMMGITTTAVVVDFMQAFVKVIAALLGVTALAATLFSAIVKKGLAFSLVPVAFKMSRVNPGQNLVNTYKMSEIKNSVYDFVKIIIWFAVVGGVLFSLTPEILTSLRLDYSRTYDLIAYLFLLLLALLIGGAVVFVGFDFVIEQKNFMEGLKMTKSEVKRERHDQHGDPKIRTWRNEMKQSLMRNTPRGAEHATVVIEGGGKTISVRFDQDQVEVPFVVDVSEKGKRGKARKKASTAGAAVIVDPKVARLLAGRNVGDLLMEEKEYMPILTAMYGSPK